MDHLSTLARGALRRERLAQSKYFPMLAPACSPDMSVRKGFWRGAWGFHGTTAKPLCDQAQWLPIQQAPTGVYICMVIASIHLINRLFKLSVAITTSWGNISWKHHVATYFISETYVKQYFSLGSSSQFTWMFLRFNNTRETKNSIYFCHILHNFIHFSSSLFKDFI